MRPLQYMVFSFFDIYYIQDISFTGYILYLTYIFVQRKVVENRVQLTPFSAPLESSSSPEANSLTTYELRMFTHHVAMNLKANSGTELARVSETEIIPLLRKQKGFRSEITTVAGG
jgi:hypothetical protein